MFGDYVYEKSSAPYSKKILLVDNDDLYRQVDYTSAFSAHGFEVVVYEDDLKFRIDYQEKLYLDNDKLVVLAHTDSYIPYDIHRRLRAYEVSLQRLFPKLNTEALKGKTETDFDLLCNVYPTNFDDLRSRAETEHYLRVKVYAKANVQVYLQQKLTKLLERVAVAKTHNDWFAIAEEKSKIDLLTIQSSIELDTTAINEQFQAYALEQFGRLSSAIDKDSPVLVSKAMDYMHDHSDKFVIIVMDGMSEFDWRIISTSFDGIEYEQAAAFAMIPSTTSISRQCLLSNKYPSQLTEPWKQSKERAEFIACAKSLGYTDAQIGYERGYDARFGSFVRCGAVIILDVDEMVHAQTQGRVGMYHDIKLLAGQNKLGNMVKRFLADGFDVYISADHGNTACFGLGRIMGSGVEVETKSHKMLVLKDFADKEFLIQKYGLVEYPKYYLPKEYDYLICNVGESLDIKGEAVMTHGGMSLDEVVVPFIKIKAVQNNG